MRIVCPRCVAQYEVDESAIPETGREVQCANCENIWFQDYIEMLPTADDIDVSEEEDRGVFDDLDGKSEASFYSDRGAGADVDDTSDDDADYNDDMDDDFDDEDDAPATNISVPPVNEDVLDVLRSEAAFSSARDQLDAAAADALDGDGEALKAALDDAPQEPEPEAEPEPDLDDLSAFLDAHTEEEPEEDLEPETAEVAEPENPDPSFDPLADLDAIRSQLNDIGAEQSETTEYEPNLPPDDPIDLDVEDAADDALATAQDALDDLAEDTQEALTDAEPEYDEPEFDTAALSAALDMGDAADEDDDDDDFDDADDGPRHAYRADGATAADLEDDVEDTLEDVADDVEEEIDEAEADLAAALSGLSGDTADDAVEAADDTIEDDDTSGAGIATAAAAVTGAAAAIGMTRPRSSGSRARARTLPGFDAAPAAAEKPVVPMDDIADTIEDAMDDVADDINLPDIEEDIAAAADTDRKADPSRRPKGDRKAMLPDVEELDASLRSEGEEPRRRDREMMDAHEEEIAKAGKGGFRRAFIWTLFIVALLIALYVLRPQLVAALPPAAMVLDPYAAAIDSIRGLINGILG